MYDEDEICIPVLFTLYRFDFSSIIYNNAWPCSKYRFSKVALHISVSHILQTQGSWYVMLVVCKAKGPSCCCPSARNINPERMQHGGRRTEGKLEVGLKFGGRDEEMSVMGKNKQL